MSVSIRSRLLLLSACCLMPALVAAWCVSALARGPDGAALREDSDSGPAPLPRLDGVHLLLVEDNHELLRRELDAAGTPRAATASPTTDPSMP